VQEYNRSRQRNQDNLDEKWMELCRLAAAEQDPEKLLALVKEINDLLEARDKQLRSKLLNDSSTQL
jgi:hypothetical protein